MMLAPFSYRSRVLSGWNVMAQTSARAAWTVKVSREVIESRMNIMTESVSSRLTADYAEMSRMSPEKVAAFWTSGSAILNALRGMQADWIEQTCGVSVVATREGRLMRSDWLDLSTRATTYAPRSFEASARLGRDAIAPAHKTASLNFSRLDKRKRKAARQ
ncbi:MAG: hypothetical protein P0Y64_00615 [Candidatus Sphingomonas colombiensis]|nr:hypothetical protein [Sphingomonas sp.]WEK43390.1 MAG: hypothetical protein P0Y64_00615 [Sphingomonas sp.]